MINLLVEGARAWNRSQRMDWILPTIFVGSMFCSAALIFLLQPMVARMAAPLLGGTSAVWNTAMVFFQAALLGGYLYAHLIVKKLSLRTQICLHALVLFAGCVALPISLSTGLGPPWSNAPALWLLCALALSVGLPYAAISATAPLLQAWYARTDRPDASNPYRLYAASNLGSLLGLAAYPLVFEPFAALQSQSVIWSIGYVLLGLGVLAAGLTARRHASQVGACDAKVANVLPTSITWKQRAAWISAAAVPSSLLLGTTQHIATDVASAPFLWVVPLALYLVTFAIAFGLESRRMNSLTGHMHLATAIAAGAFFTGLSWIFSLPITLSVFFFSALLCHSALSVMRPQAKDLTEFYLLVSLGGVLGGAVTALAAPVLLNGVLEYPIALALAALFRVRSNPSMRLGSIVLAGLGLSAAAIVFATSSQTHEGSTRLILLVALGLLAGALVANRTRPLAFAALLFATLLTSERGADIGNVVAQDRSFFGVSRVVQSEGPDGPVSLLMHGTTLHGVQLRDVDKQRTGMAYFSLRTPLGEAIAKTIAAAPPRAEVGVIGLGVGSVSCHLKQGDNLRYFEIDPVVVDFAQRHFTYLARCAPNAEIILGDGRQTVAQLPDGALDVLVVDAFSSDAVPTHLLTREAMQLYVSKIDERGVIVFNLSSRNLALASEVARLVNAEGLAAVLSFGGERTDLSAGDFSSMQTQSMVVARTQKQLDAISLSDAWKRVGPSPGDPWTDDYVNFQRAIAGHLRGET